MITPGTPTKATMALALTATLSIGATALGAANANAKPNDPKRHWPRPTPVATKTVTPTKTPSPTITPKPSPTTITSTMPPKPTVTATVATPTPATTTSSPTPTITSSTQTSTPTTPTMTPTLTPSATTTVTSSPPTVDPKVGSNVDSLDSDIKPKSILAPSYLNFTQETYNLKAYKTETDPALKNLWWQLAGTPQAVWYQGTGTNDFYMKERIDLAEKAGAAQTIVLYGIPHRDCGFYSAGGLIDSPTYTAWIDKVSSIIGDRSVVVVVEPDAIGYCKGVAGVDSKAVQAQWEPLLKYVGKKLHDNNKNAAVYVHAGSGTLGQDDTVNSLKGLGVENYRGLAMNVASHNSIAANEAWAEAVISKLKAAGYGTKHYIVDSGRSAVTRPANPQAPYNSCNNFNAGAGTRPTHKTVGAHADAYLWIKTIGLSDGECQKGDPAAATWYPSLAKSQLENGLKVGAPLGIERLETGVPYSEPKD